MPVILLIIGIILIVYNYRAIRLEEKDKQEDNGFNLSFQSVLQDRKEELSDYKMEMGLLRKDIAESLTELQEEIFDIKKDIHRLQSENFHLLKDINAYRSQNNNDDLLKNNEDQTLKSSEEMYENKEGLENSHLMDESKVDISLNEPNEIMLENGDLDKVDSIDYQTDERINLDSEAGDGVISEIDFSAKVDSNKTARIKRLLGEGLTEEQICHELSVSKGEVLLVKGLFKK
ncbi:hypothetical protein [Clostridium sp. C2-6-12]|uniref:hypothetical protein n=1 Tax=Clostridium sp. C2-6-12 TaxID=2698832 RepID=UPI001370EAFC|nr:hypothetical protein [Clostridium sp. C2-6-12]